MLSTRHSFEIQRQNQLMDGKRYSMQTVSPQKAGVAVLVSGKTDSKSKKFTRDKGP